MGKEKGENAGKHIRNKKHNWSVPNRPENVKNSIGNGEDKELIHKLMDMK